MVLRALVSSGRSQREIAESLGISQPAVSQQLRSAPDSGEFHPAVVLEAAAPILKTLAEESGYSRLAVFGSVARQEASIDSDIDLLVQAPPDASSFDLVRFQQLLVTVVGRPIDIVEYGGLSEDLDADVRREAMML